MNGFDDYEEEDIGAQDEDDELEEALQNCGMGRDGQCSMAGSEECDFDCPIMANVLRESRIGESRKEAAKRKSLAPSASADARGGKQ